MFLRQNVPKFFRGFFPLKKKVSLLGKVCPLFLTGTRINWSRFVGWIIYTPSIVASFIGISTCF
jgi:hypothetical protein